MKAWRSLRSAAGLEDLRIHDLRHSLPSVAVADGESLVIVGKVLGHRQTSTTDRYAHLSDDPLRAAAGRISQKVARFLDGSEPAEAVEAEPVRPPATRPVRRGCASARRSSRRRSSRREPTHKQRQMTEH